MQLRDVFSAVSGPTILAEMVKGDNGVGLFAWIIFGVAGLFIGYLIVDAYMTRRRRKFLEGLYK